MLGFNRGVPPPSPTPPARIAAELAHACIELGGRPHGLTGSLAPAEEYPGICAVCAKECWDEHSNGLMTVRISRSPAGGSMRDGGDATTATALAGWINLLACGPCASALRDAYRSLKARHPCGEDPADKARRRFKAEEKARSVERSRRANERERRRQNDIDKARREEIEQLNCRTSLLSAGPRTGLVDARKTEEIKASSAKQAIIDCSNEQCPHELPAMHARYQEIIEEHAPPDHLLDDDSCSLPGIRTRTPDGNPFERPERLQPHALRRVAERIEADRFNAPRPLDAKSTSHPFARRVPGAGGPRDGEASEAACKALEQEEEEHAPSSSSPSTTTTTPEPEPEEPEKEEAPPSPDVHPPACRIYPTADIHDNMLEIGLAAAAYDALDVLAVSTNAGGPGICTDGCGGASTPKNLIRVCKIGPYTYRLCRLCRRIAESVTRMEKYTTERPRSSPEEAEQKKDQEEKKKEAPAP